MLFSVPCVGNTVIHLDQALARMREYERVKTEAEGNTDTTCSCRIVEDGDEAATAAAADDVEGVFLDWWEVNMVPYTAMKNPTWCIIVLLPLF